MVCREGGERECRGKSNRKRERECDVSDMCLNVSDVCLDVSLFCLKREREGQRDRNPCSGGVNLVCARKQLLRDPPKNTLQINHCEESERKGKTE